MKKLANYLSTKIGASLLTSILLLGGCASVRSVSITQIPAKRSQRVSAEVSKFVFLAFNFDNDYVDILTQKLKNKCRNGHVQGILTKHEVKHYVFFSDTKITATGYCNKKR